MGLRTAIGTLTIIPVGAPKRPDFGKAVLYFPLVGLILGVLLCGIAWILLSLFQTEAVDLIALLLVAVSSFLTGGLHLDGLGDFMDSLGASNRDRRLEIMKDKHVGVFAVAGVALALLLKYAGIKGLLIKGSMLAILVPMVLSRGAMTLLASFLPYARADGTGRPFVVGVRRPYAFWVTVGTFLLPSLWGLKFLGVSLALFFISLLLMRYFKKRYGGITGDLLGASNEIMEVMGFISLNLII